MHRYATFLFDTPFLSEPPSTLPFRTIPERVVLKTPPADPLSTNRISIPSNQIPTLSTT